MEKYCNKKCVYESRLYDRLLPQRFFWTFSFFNSANQSLCYLELVHLKKLQTMFESNCLTQTFFVIISNEAAPNEWRKKIKETFEEVINRATCSHTHIFYCSIFPFLERYIYSMIQVCIVKNYACINYLSLDKLKSTVDQSRWIPQE